MHLQRETAGEFEASQTHRDVPTHTDLFALARKKVPNAANNLPCGKVALLAEEKVSPVPQPICQRRQPGLITREAEEVLKCQGCGQEAEEILGGKG